MNILKMMSLKNFFKYSLWTFVFIFVLSVTKVDIMDYNVQARKAGRTKWNWFSLFKLSIDAITSYSAKPLQIVTFLGFLSLIFSIILSIQTLYNKFFGDAVSGFTTVILVSLVLSSIIMISIGILGIYISKLYNEVKNRPIYVVEDQKVSKIDSH